jgi:hypothetical protein
VAPKKTSKKQSKSDFIRSQPATLSATEVVAKAKAAEITFSPQLVYNVRNGSKAQKGTAKRTAKAKPTTTSKRATAPRQAPPVPRPITVRGPPRIYSRRSPPRSGSVEPSSSFRASGRG